MKQHAKICIISLNNIKVESNKSVFIRKYFFPEEEINRILQEIFRPFNFYLWPIYKKNYGNILPKP